LGGFSKTLFNSKKRKSVLDVRLLGQFLIYLDGVPVQINSRPAQSLLAYLVINAGVAFRREKLAGMLWPDTTEANARNNLRQALWRIRKHLESDPSSPQPVFLVDDLTVAFNSETDYSLDAIKLEAKVDQSVSLSRLIEQVSTYEGELLPGFYDDWIVLERERLQSIFEVQMDLLIQRLLENQDWPGVIKWSEGWIALGTVPEPAYRYLMMAHAGRGDLSRMTATYRRGEAALLDELGVEPSETTRVLYKQLKTGNDVVPKVAKQRDQKYYPPALEESPAPGEPPYKGLQFYEEADADNFFGREQITESIFRDLNAGSSFMAVLGASGSGKSSVVRAGLIPALKSGRLPETDLKSSHLEGPAWKVILLTPTANPIEALAKSINQGVQEASLPTSLESELTSETGSLLRYLSNALDINPKSAETSQCILIVIDQFEELFTLCQDETSRQAFINNLVVASNPDTKERISVLITLRADFYAHCGQYPELRQALTRNQVYLGPMNAEEIRKVIEGPANRGAWRFESGLVELILRDVSKEPGALPLLSHALLETWRRRSGRSLTLQGYATSGGVRGGIARTAESVYNRQLSADQQHIAKNIFLRLTNLGEETEGTRRRVKQAELFLATESAAPVQEVLRVLADARLITIDETSVEVAHEALITEWPTLRSWLVENREGLRIHRHLTDSAQAWEELDRNPGELYRGARLSQALEWADTNQMELSILEQEFLASSKERAEQAENERRAQQERELAAALELAQAQQERAEAVEELAENQTRSVAQLRRRAVYLTIALFFVLAMAGIALFLGDRVRQVAITAQANAERAEEEASIAFSRELAAAAISNLDLDPERSILLALSAVSQAQSSGLPVPREAEEALHKTVTSSRLRRSMTGGFSVDFSPDGNLIAYSGPASTAIIEEFPSGREKLVLSGHSNDLFGVSVHFSSDGKRLITTSADGTAKVWDISKGTELLTLRGHTATLTDGIISPDGTLLATTGNDGTARVWDSESGEELLQIMLPEPGGIAFDPAGSYLAVADASSTGGTIEIWEVSPAQKRVILPGHDQGTLSVDFNLDGTRLISAGQDGRIKVWDWHSGDELFTIDDAVPIYELAISPEDGIIATGGEDGVAKVWEIESGDLLYRLPGHTDTVSFVAFSPDSKYLATSSFDQTTKIWDISPEGKTEFLTLPGHSRVIMSAVYSPDSKKIVTGSWDKSAIVWDANSGRKLLTLDNFNGELGRMTFNPEQTQLASADFSGSVKIWNADTGKLIHAIQADSPGDIDAAFSPHGDYIASGGSEGTVKLWATDTGKLMRTFEGHSDQIQRITFSPDGIWLASASWDGTAKIWQVQTGELLTTLSANSGNVRSVNFSPDGRRLATAHEDGSIRIWNTSQVESGLENSEKLLYTLIGHSNTVFDAEFSPDGTRLATCSFDGTIRLWDVETGREQLVLAEDTPGPDLDFSQNGKYLVLAGGDGTARVFVLPIEDLIELAKTRLTRPLSTVECQKYLHLDACPDDERNLHP
jgi:WD40 repeat protein/DNA-binding SARP family transcriptional activator